jgi:hypothetical protein
VGLLPSSPPIVGPVAAAVEQCRSVNLLSCGAAVFDWLFEGLTAVYILLGTALLFVIVLYWRWRRKYWLYVMGTIVAFIGLYALLDRLVETDTEQLERKIKAMAAGLEAHNVDALFDNIDEHYKSPSMADKKALRELADTHINQISDVRVRNFDFKVRPERGKEFTGLRFMFKIGGVGVDNLPFDCEPVFEYDPVKGWRVTRFKVFKFGTTEEYQVPF